AGQRVFNITINEQPAQAWVDIFAETGYMTPYLLHFIVELDTDLLTIHFDAVADSPKVNGITIVALDTPTAQQTTVQPTAVEKPESTPITVTELPATASTGPPGVALRINAGGGALLDNLQRLFLSDTFYKDGTVIETLDSISQLDTYPSGLYASCRAGVDFKYRFQVADLLAQLAQMNEGSTTDIKSLIITLHAVGLEDIPIGFTIGIGADISAQVQSVPLKQATRYRFELAVTDLDLSGKLVIRLEADEPNHKAIVCGIEIEAL
ncbi:uncharacterized protein MONBRDRAFT_30687, partial [Monosiga brevicollis MX1]